MLSVAVWPLLVGGAVVLVSLVVLHALPTRLNPWRDAVSQYGITRYRLGYLLAAFGAALGGVGGALLFGALPGGMYAAVLLWIFAAARVLIPFFPMDDPEAPRTDRGRVHSLLAVIAFATITAAGFFGAGVLHDAGRPGLSTLSTIAAVVMAVGSAGVILGLFTALRRLFGLAERLIYLGFIGWFLALGIGQLTGV